MPRPSSRWIAAGDPCLSGPPASRALRIGVRSAPAGECSNQFTILTGVQRDERTLVLESASTQYVYLPFGTRVVSRP